MVQLVSQAQEKRKLTSELACRWVRNPLHRQQVPRPIQQVRHLVISLVTAQNSQGHTVLSSEVVVQLNKEIGIGRASSGRLSWLGRSRSRASDFGSGSGV